MAPTTLPLFAYHIAGIIPHPTENRVLLVSTSDGWSLPQLTWQATEWWYWADVTRLNRDMRRQLGMELTTLRCLSDNYDAETTGFFRVFVMELHSDAARIPEQAQWVATDELAGMRLAGAEQQVGLAQWLAGHADATDTSQRVPWYNAGWFAQASAWIAAQLSALEAQRTAQIEQLRVSERGCLLRAQTTNGAFYFKALPPFTAHEPALVRYLADEYPSNVPQLVAVETDARWMLMRDFGDRLLSQSEDMADWEAALRQYALLQIEQVDHVEHLKALGCHRLSVEMLSERLDDLLDDRQKLLIASPLSLSEDELLSLRRLAPRLRALCEQLASGPIPCSLEHGDFYGENIALTGTGPLYFDWTDSRIAHPFFSLYFFLIGLEARWSAIPDRRSHLRDVYLHPWRRYAPEAQLVAIFELAQRLAPLYLASLYYFQIIPNMKAKWEMRHGVPNNLRTLLDRMQDEASM